MSASRSIDRSSGRSTLRRRSIAAWNSCRSTSASGSSVADRPGIVRLFEGQVRPGELDAYVDDARAGTLLDAAAGSGPMALYLARRTADAFVTLSVWPDWSTLQDATGGDVERPIATRHAHRLVAWHAEHYESIPGLTPARRTPATTS